MQTWRQRQLQLNLLIKMPQQRKGKQNVALITGVSSHLSLADTAAFTPFMLAKCSSKTQPKSLNDAVFVSLIMRVFKHAHKHTYTPTHT